MKNLQFQEEPPKGAPLWVSTFGDLMNLLLCFFVLLFSMSSVDAQKYAEVVQSLSQTFNADVGFFRTEGGENVVENKLFPESVNQIEQVKEVMDDTGTPKDEVFTVQNFNAEKYMEQKNKEAAERLYRDVSKMVENAAIDSTVQVAMDKQYQYVKLYMSGAVLFDSGEVEIKAGSLKVLNKIGDILKNYEDNLIKIEGHTDNQPVVNGPYKDNMHLSSERAYSVWIYMITKKKLDPANIEASGRSEYEPMADNTTAAGRAKNRRVEFKIYTDLVK